MAHTPALKAAQIKLILKRELAKVGSELISFDGRMSRMIINTNGVVRISWLYKGINEENVISSVASAVTYGKRLEMTPQQAAALMASVS